MNIEILEEKKIYSPMDRLEKGELLLKTYSLISVTCRYMDRRRS